MAEVGMAEKDENGLPNCWEIEGCGREEGGLHEAEFGACVTAKEGMGHSCWAVAGTLCRGEVQGTIAQKKGLCTFCQVYKLYNRNLGSRGKEVSQACPAEQEKYIKLMLAHWSDE